MLEWMVLMAVRAALTASTREVNCAVMSTFSSAAATGAGAVIAGATTVLATTTGAGAAMTGAGAATAAVVAVAVDFLVVFLGAVAELDICISVFEEVFGAYKRGNDDGN